MPQAFRIAGHRFWTSLWYCDEMSVQVISENHGRVLAGGKFPYENTRIVKCSKFPRRKMFRTAIAKGKPPLFCAVNVYVSGAIYAPMVIRCFGREATAAGCPPITILEDNAPAHKAKWVCYNLCLN